MTIFRIGVWHVSDMHPVKLKHQMAMHSMSRFVKMKFKF